MLVKMGQMINTTLAHYQITAKLGQGGMGEVYRATDTKLGRDVAIKVLPEAFASNKERLARFEREAKALAQLNHSHIAAFHGFDQSGGQWFLAMELVEGEDISVRLKRGAMPVEEALEVCKQIAEALEAAHEKGIIHRDLKPANVKLTEDGQVKVLDFGLAKIAESAEGDGSRLRSPHLDESPTITADYTMPGTLLGTAAYMSPEQARGKPVDKRSDIWSFGCVLFECLTGQRLFQGKQRPIRSVRCFTKNRIGRCSPTTHR
jgi:serine/threonine-protein kinase